MSDITIAADPNSEITVEQILEPLARAALNAHFPKTDKNGHPSLTRFFLENGRLPHITDEIKPWEYKGWLLAYVVEIQRVHPAIPDRYGYFFRTIDAGQLLDEPIPEIEFSSEFDRDIVQGKKEMEKWETIISHSFGVWDGFRILIDWFSWALGTENEPPKLNDKINEELYRTVNVGPMLLTPCDYFGSYLAEKKARGWNPNAFFPTPHTVVDLMTRMTFSDSLDNRSKTVNDCCVGTGRMLLHASNYSLRLSGNDIDPLVVKITKINGALYAPWLTFPFPEEIFGDDEKESSAEKLEEKENEKTPVKTPEQISPVIKLEQIIKPPETQNKSRSRRKEYRTNEAQGLLFEFD